MPIFRTGEDRVILTACANCGQPTTGPFCAFCRARAQVLGERLVPPPAPEPPEELARELADEVLPTELYDVAAEAR
jgi:predicted RNA-binding protein with PUA domain